MADPVAAVAAVAARNAPPHQHDNHPQQSALALAGGQAAPQPQPVKWSQAGRTSHGKRHRGKGGNKDNRIPTLTPQLQRLQDVALTSKNKREQGDEVSRDLPLWEHTSNAPGTIKSAVFKMAKTYAINKDGTKPTHVPIYDGDVILKGKQNVFLNAATTAAPQFVVFIASRDDLTPATVAWLELRSFVSILCRRSNLVSLIRGDGECYILLRVTSMNIPCDRQRLHSIEVSKQVKLTAEDEQWPTPCGVAIPRGKTATTSPNKHTLEEYAAHRRCAYPSHAYWATSSKDLINSYHLFLPPPPERKEKSITESMIESTAEVFSLLPNTCNMMMISPTRARIYCTAVGDIIALSNILLDRKGQVTHEGSGQRVGPSFTLEDVMPHRTTDQPRGPTLLVPSNVAPETLNFILLKIECSTGTRTPRDGSDLFALIPHQNSTKLSTLETGALWTPQGSVYLHIPAAPGNPGAGQQRDPSNPWGNQVPNQPPQGNPNPLPAHPLDRPTKSHLPQNDAKTAQGEALLPLVQKITPTHTAKIVSMLLEQDDSTIHELLADPSLLRPKVETALTIITAHETSSSSTPERHAKVPRTNPPPTPSKIFGLSTKKEEYKQQCVAYMESAYNFADSEVKTAALQHIAQQKDLQTIMEGGHTTIVNRIHAVLDLFTSAPYGQQNGKIHILATLQKFHQHAQPMFITKPMLAVIDKLPDEDQRQIQKTWARYVTSQWFRNRLDEVDIEKSTNDLMALPASEMLPIMTGTDGFRAHLEKLFGVQRVDDE